MDAIRILGDLLGNRHVSRGRGTNILESVLGNRSPVPAPTRRSPRSNAYGRPVNRSQLGGLIRAAAQTYGHYKNERDRRKQNERGNDHGHDHHDYSPRPVNPGECRFPDDRVAANHQAQLLIRAMIYAAKSDGRLDPKEQQKIVSQMGYLSADERQWLQYEFSRPIDTCAFAREVPPGLEDEVYTVSLTAIDLDTNREARYLHDLAHELELSHDEVNYLHRYAGVPSIF